MFFCFSSAHSIGQDRKSLAWSYTLEELHLRAQAFMKIRELSKKSDGDLSTALMAGEFKGYVAAVVDGGANKNPELENCAKKNTVNEIAVRTAILLTAMPFDRSGIAAARIHLAVLMACDEETFEKPAR
jgi:hypothetical protein